MSTTLFDALSGPAADMIPPERLRTAPVNMFNKALCLKVDMGALGTRRKLGSDQVKVDADADRISAAKSILASKEYDAIRAAQGAISKQIRKLCLPSMFKSGIYLIPIASIPDIDKLLDEAQNKIMAELVPAFMAIYPTLVENDKISLRTTFDEKDYPPTSKVRQAFYFEWSYISFGVPDALKNVDTDLFRREQEKAASKLAEATDQVTQVLRAQMLDLVDHLTERLTGTRKGDKPKIFKDSLVENVKDFLATFKNRNIVDDTQLDALCDKAKGLLDGVDPDALRESDQTREKVRAGFAEIKETLDSMTVSVPSRMVEFEAEESAA